MRLGGLLTMSNVRPIRPTVSIPVTILLVVVTALLAGQAGAVRAMAKPISLGTVNLNRIMEELHERAEWDAQMREREESFLAEIRSRQADLNQRKANLDELPEGEQADLAREGLALELVRLETWYNFRRSELDRERSLMWQSLFRSIRAEAERLAASEGLDLVLVNDMRAELQTSPESNLPAEAQVIQQLASRRVLFAGREIDLTDRLVTRMNNARAARP